MMRTAYFNSGTLKIFVMLLLFYSITPAALAVPPGLTVYHPAGEVTAGAFPESLTVNGTLNVSIPGVVTTALYVNSTGATVKGNLTIEGSSPSFLKFGTGSNMQTLQYDPSSQQFQFSGGKMAQDFSSIARNGGFESFSGGGTWGGDQIVAIPDDWVLVNGSAYQYAPSTYSVGSDVFQGYNALKIDPTSNGNFGKITQDVFTNKLQPGKSYSIGVWAKVAGDAVAKLGISGSALSGSFTEQTTTATAWTLLKGHFTIKSTLSPGDVIVIELRVSGTGGAGNFGFFDAAQMNAGNMVGEYQEAPLTGVGDQIIYGGLRLRRTGSDRGGILTVDKAVRTRQIEFSYGSDAGWGGLDTKYMNDPRYAWTSTYSQAPVFMELIGNNEIVIKSSSSTSELRFDVSQMNNPVITTQAGKAIRFAAPVKFGNSIIVNGTDDTITATTGTIGFGGTKLVNIGNVGIGTTSAASDRLEIAGFIKSISGTNNARIGFDGTNAIFTSSTGNIVLDAAALVDVYDTIHAPVYKDRDGANYYLDPASSDTSLLVAGKVGIGTTAPVQKLVVIGDANVTGTLYVGAQSFTNLDALGNTVVGRNLTVSNNVLFVSNLTERVGIGTTAPAYKLDVSGTIRATDILFSDGSSTSGTLTFDAYNNILVNSHMTMGSGKTLYTNALNARGNLQNDNGVLTIPDDVNIGSGDLYVDNTAGNVGIGTTSPQAKLDVEGGAIEINNTTPILRWNENDQAADTKAWDIISGGGQLKLRTLTDNFGTAVDLLTISRSAGTPSKVNWNTPNEDVDFVIEAVGTANALFVQGSDGNVGIGTASPLGKFDVRPDVAGGWATTEAILFSEISDNPYIAIYRPTGDGTTAFPWRIKAESDDLVIQTGSAAAIGSETVATKLMIDQAGNVGIGTTTPEYLLSVYDGNPSANEVLFDISTNGGSRFSVDEDGDVTISGILGVSGTSLRSNTLNSNSNLYMNMDWNNNEADTSIIFGKNAEGSSATALMIIKEGGNVGIGTTSPSGRLHVGGNVVIMGDKLVDADGSVSTAVGAAAAISEDATLVVVEAADSLCTDSLTAPTKLRIDTDSNCATAGGTALLGDGTGAVAVTSAWAFSDTVVVNSAYNDGEDIYIDNAPSLVYTSGNVGIGTTGPNTKLKIVQSADTSSGGLAIADSSDTSYLRVWRNGAGAGTYTMFTDQGTDTMALSAGNVGIGTTIPGQLLHLYKSSGNVYQAIETDSAGTAGFITDGARTTNAQISVWSTLNAGDSVAEISVNREGANDAAYIEFDTQPTGGGLTERMRITSAGSVGIGTTGPATKLHVYETTANNPSIRIENSQNSAGKNAFIDVLVGGTSAGDATYRANVNGGNWWSWGLRNSDSDKFYITTASDLSSGNVFTIDRTGNVGIGTTGPGAKLYIQDATSPNLILENSIANSASSGYIGLREADTAFGAFVTYDGSANLFHLGTRNSGTDSNRLTIVRGSGNVGIGTTAPAKELDVAGSARFGAIYTEHDTLVDANGAGAGEGQAAAISENGVLVAVEAGDNLCTDSLTAPTKVRVDTTCATTGDGTAILGDNTAGTTQVTSAWAFNDAEGCAGCTTNSAYDIGEDLYIDSFPSLKFNHGNVKIAGDLFVMRNITAVDVTSLNINGSLLPPPGFSNAYDIGSSAQKWRTGYFGTDMNIGGAVILKDGGTDIYTPNDNQAAYYDFLTDAEGAARSNDAFVRVWGDGTAGTNYLTLTHTGASGYGSVTTGAGNLLLDSNSDTLDIDTGTIDFSTQAVGVTLNNAANALAFDTDTLSIDALNNRVGIGTTGPGAKLEIAAPSSGATVKTSVLSGQAALDIYQSGTQNGWIGSSGVGGNLLIQSGAGKNLQINAITTLNFLTNSVENMRLSATGGLSLGSSYIETDPGAGSMIISGNVGIGTTAPAVGLHIGTAALASMPAAANSMKVSGGIEVDGASWFIGQTAFTNNLVVSGGDSYFFRAANVDGNFFKIGARDTEAQAIVEVGRVAGASDPYFSTGGSQQFKFYNSGKLEFPGSGTITSAGNVGIGTTSPQGLLHVASSATSDNLILSQAATTNIVTNPSFEVGLTGWFAYADSASPTRITSDSYVGAASMQMTTSGAGPNEGVMLNPSGPAGGETWTFSAYINRAETSANLNIGICDHVSGGAWSCANSAIPKVTGWQRVSITKTLQSGTIDSLQAIINHDSALVVVTFKVDGAQFEQKSAATPYADGSLGPGYSWSGTAHASSSSRTAGAGFSYQTINSASGLGAAARSTSPALRIEQDGTGPVASFFDTQTEVMRIADGGNVGIGTTGPIGVLHIEGGPSSGTTPPFIIGGGVSTGDINDLYILDSKNVNTGVGFAARVLGINIQTQTDASNQVLQRTVWSGVSGAAAIYLGADDVNQGVFGVLGSPQGSTAGTVLSEYLTVRGNGNVGIGTTAPKVKLHTIGTAALPSSSGAVANGIGLFEGNSEALVVGLDPANQYGGWIQVQNVNTASTYRPLLLQPNGGNVGIGTTAPSDKLEVVGGSIQVDNNRGISSKLTPGAGGNVANLAMLDSSNNLIFGTSAAANSLQLRVNSATARMYIDSSGNVGIGTTSPQQKLTLASASNFATEMAAPGAPTGTPSGTGGSMATGTYYYAITALDGVGETVKGTQSAAVAVTGPTGSVALSWTAIQGAASYKVYRTTTSGTYSTPALIGNPTAASLTDTLLTPSTGAPPTVTTAYVNKLTASGNSWLLGGNVGIGTTNPGNYKLNVAGNAYISGNIEMSGGGVIRTDEVYGKRLLIANTENWALVPLGESMYVEDDVKVAGNILGVGGDIAERMFVYGDAEAGDVVIIAGNMTVQRASKAYDRRVVGVVSTDPSYILAEDRDGLPIALSGTVPVKVVGHVSAGDLLTASDVAGYAMRCEDREKCSGAIIGKALESMEGKGTINMLVMMG